MNPEIQQLMDEIRRLEDRVNDLEYDQKNHTHRGTDGSKKLEYDINLKPKNFYAVGSAQSTSFINNEGATGEDHIHYLSSIGKDAVGTFTKDSKNAEVALELPINDSSHGGFLYGFCPPVYTSNTTISVSSSATTVTDSTRTWATNELAGMYLRLFNASGSNDNTYLIASNTGTTITINTTSTTPTTIGFTDNVYYQISMPMYLGAAQYPWRRVYTATDIRFGTGSSSGANVVFIKFGIGSPEGAVTANVGSLYLRMDGSTSTSLYVKTSGTGNTGWTAK